MKITRRQLPLAPAFAVTAHTAQGQTKDSAIVDLQISKGTSPIASYVAMTRVEKKENVLIYRPFERNLFTGGPVEGPATLLKVWRGENVDWKALEDKHIPKRECTGCKAVTNKEDYAASQWNRRDGYHYCQTCVKGKVQRGTPLECLNCHRWRPEEAFSEDQRQNRVHRLCEACIDRRKCKGCHEMLLEQSFTSSEWTHALKMNSYKGRCRKRIGPTPRKMH